MSAKKKFFDPYSQELHDYLNFWHFFRHEGIKAFSSTRKKKIFLFIEFSMSLALSLLLYIKDMSIVELSGLTLIPLITVLIGSSFSWVANAATVLTMQEASDIGQIQNFRRWVFLFQTSVFVVIVSISIWCLISSGLVVFPVPEIFGFHLSFIVYIFMNSLAIFTAILAVSEVWSMISTTQVLLVEFNYFKLFKEHESAKNHLNKK